MVSITTPVSGADLPAIFDSLNDDTLGLVLKFVGDKCYRSFGGLNKHCKEVYLNTPGMTKETFMYGYGRLSVIINKIEGGEQTDWDLHERVGKGVVSYGRKDVLDWALEEKNYRLLNEICIIAGKEGRIDILIEMWNHIEDEGAKRYVFYYVDGHAAQNGKLDVLKWFETKGFTINEEYCAEEAARHGQLHIIQWLKEESRLELYKDLYIYAINGGQLHVMKWLREQACPWVYDTFRKAAEEGNLNILQWLHDEGCPWSVYNRVDVEEVTSEVIEWLRTNGYGDRIDND